MSRHFQQIFRPSLHSGQKIHRKCLDIRLVSKNTSKKSQQALEKKTARLNFISARQHSQQTYINSYYAICLKIHKLLGCCESWKLHEFMNCMSCSVAIWKKTWYKEGQCQNHVTCKRNVCNVYLCKRNLSKPSRKSDGPAEKNLKPDLKTS